MTPPFGSQYLEMSSLGSIRHIVRVTWLEDGVLFEICGNAVNFWVWSHVDLEALGCVELWRQKDVRHGESTTTAVISVRSHGCFVASQATLEEVSSPRCLCFVSSDFSNFLEGAEVNERLGHRVNNFAQLAHLLPSKLTFVIHQRSLALARVRLVQPLTDRHWLIHHNRNFGSSRCGILHNQSGHQLFTIHKFAHTKWLENEKGGF